MIIILILLGINFSTWFSNNISADIYFFHFFLRKQFFLKIYAVFSIKFYSTFRSKFLLNVTHQIDACCCKLTKQNTDTH